MRSYEIMVDKSVYVDSQTLKLQESPETIPTGEMPRHIMLSCERVRLVLPNRISLRRRENANSEANAWLTRSQYLCDRVVPGTRVTAVGIFTIIQHAAPKKVSGGAIAIRQPYIRVLGLHIDTDVRGPLIYGLGFGWLLFGLLVVSAHAHLRSPLGHRPHESGVPAGRGGALPQAGPVARLLLAGGQEHSARHLRPRQCAARTLPASPSQTDPGRPLPDIKKAIACLLFSGSRKRLPDGMRLRGGAAASVSDLSRRILTLCQISTSCFLEIQARPNRSSSSSSRRWRPSPSIPPARARRPPVSLPPSSARRHRYPVSDPAEPSLTPCSASSI